ncbi:MULTISPECIES: nucleotide sugar dehydrogenase [Chryseobacterium]|uniref:nucleotide sugar dehydrogenase n=1 Tax=Chryseobacterium TaxID=59732 RepID=UPI00049319C2|nr:MULTISPECIES: nucleotide sugar dehydrogenase [Chryseobacterium]MDR6158529.1 UDP-N-acetyl-D-galactosamine dehydrogenase [Chryseobacterium sp. SLBN-27]
MIMYKIAVIGQGYVGLPLSLEFANHYPVLGFDINPNRVKQLNEGKDITLEADTGKLQERLKKHKESNGTIGYRATSELSDIAASNIYIVTVPTPIDKYNAPDLNPLISASKMLGGIIKKGDIVIYESTVFPGCTEEECVPVLEKYSGLKYNEDFFVGYSPERINPGDKVNTLTSVKKVTSGSTEKVAEEVDNLYKKIITAGTHKAPSLKVAEASKAIENAQRDVNISFVNELALIFDRIGIDTHDVLEAAGTKYNFLKYKPGLVGGHCISVDPYYLAHKAEQLGYHPDVILSGRRVNDSIAKFIASKVVKLLIAKGGIIKDSEALILGVTFKENCPDVRNTKVVDIYTELKDYGVNVDIYDPWANKDEIRHEYGIDILNTLIEGKKYDSVIIAVSHDEFLQMDLDYLKKDNAVVFDTKACFDRSLVDARL